MKKNFKKLLGIIFLLLLIIIALVGMIDLFKYYQKKELQKNLALNILLGS